MAITATTLTIHSPKDNLVFGENNIKVSLNDEAGGYFVTIKSVMDDSSINLDFSEAYEVFEAIKQLEKIKIDHENGK